MVAFVWGHGMAINVIGLSFLIIALENILFQMYGKLRSGAQGERADTCQVGT
jgi:uncharacterized membrane protein